VDSKGKHLEGRKELPTHQRFHLISLLFAEMKASQHYLPWVEEALNSCLAKGNGSSRTAVNAPGFPHKKQIREMFVKIQQEQRRTGSEHYLPKVKEALRCWLAKGSGKFTPAEAITMIMERFGREINSLGFPDMKQIRKIFAELQEEQRRTDSERFLPAVEEDLRCWLDKINGSYIPSWTIEMIMESLNAEAGSPGFPSRSQIRKKFAELKQTQSRAESPAQYFEKEESSFDAVTDGKALPYCNRRDNPSSGKRAVSTMS
jgi:hypothetical protein